MFSNAGTPDYFADQRTAHPTKRGYLILKGRSLIITRGGGLLISGKVSAGNLRPPLSEGVLILRPPLSEGVLILRPPLSEGVSILPPPSAP